MSTYIPFRNTDTGKWFACFNDGSSAGPFDSYEEMEIGVEVIRRNIAAGGKCTVSQWIKCSEQLPPIDEVVMTKIDDSKGCRNEQKLKRYQREPGKRSLWFLPDGSMYVYYEPTHWRAA